MPFVKELALTNINQWVKEQQRRRDNLQLALNSLPDPGSDYGETIKLLMDLCDDTIITMGSYVGKLEDEG